VNALSSIAIHCRYCHALFHQPGGSSRAAAAEAEAMQALPQTAIHKTTIFSTPAVVDFIMVFVRLKKEIPPRLKYPVVNQVYRTVNFFCNTAGSGRCAGHTALTTLKIYYAE
jgi:hypothetical protein